MTDQFERTIKAARRSFNSELLSADYPRIHGNDDQVARLVAFLDPQPGGSYLDLATGSGIVAFAVAGRSPEAQVFAIDIADAAIARNQAAAKQQGRSNIEFFLSDGRNIDFADAAFDAIACRYALHHFPDIETTLAEVRRVLKPGGTFAVADVIRHPSDNMDFVNRFQALKPDGHVRIHSADGLIELFRARGFTAEARFGSEISFSRDLNTAYSDLIDATAPEILSLYGVKVAGGKAALTFDILNVRFVAAAD